MELESLARDLRAALADIRRERDQLTAHIALIEETIQKLSRLRGDGRAAGGRAAAASRPPAKASKARPSGKDARPSRAKVKAAAPAPRRRAKPNWPPEARQAAAERMRKYWAERRAQRGHDEDPSG